MNDDSNTFVWDAQVAVSKIAPYRVAGIWKQGNDMSAKLFDENFNAIKEFYSWLLKQF